MGTNIEPSLIQRVVAGVRYMVSGVGPTNWFGPSQPLAPQAQDKVEGRAFDYPVGFNLRITPREGEVSFATLRALADGYDLLRLVIETRKDQVEAFEWEIVPAKKDDSAEQYAADIERITEFMRSPDKEHNWPQWLRMQLEDLLVIDAIAVYPRENRGGGLYALELIDAATLKRVIDDTGRTPLPPDPAYQQILKGIPAADYSRDDIVYAMRNPRTNRIYGYSPVEQVIMTVNIALRRQLSQLDFYTAGNIPEAIAQVPDNWTAQQLKEFQLWWDSLMEGNSATKRKMRFIPMLKDIFFPKKEILKDEFDEWLARIVCFAFSISPSALIKQVNRASGEQMADTAKEEGLLPLLRFIEAHLTTLVQRYLGAPKLRFQFKVVNRVSPLEQAQVNKIYLDSEVVTPDEIREDIGRDAMTPEQREAAWPSPPPPGFNADGTPVLPKQGEEGAPGEAKPVAPPTETPAEKMLAKVVDMLDPERLAGVLAKLLIDRVRAEPPTVVKVEGAQISTGPTTVNVPAPQPPEPDRALEKRLAEGGEATAAGLQAVAAAVDNLAKRDTAPITLEAHITNNVPENPVTVNVGETHVEAPVTVNTPEAKVEVPITVQPAEAPHVDVHLPEASGTRQTIERDHRGEIVSVETKPIK
jgi:hypothetical protein